MFNILDKQEISSEIKKEIEEITKETYELDIINFRKKHKKRNNLKRIKKVLDYFYKLAKKYE
ncbi:hypothetical protein KY331_03095, partial [Candidatus Woesearchaeota archaeon]|nr:hypothetical protein [Candidatus Woesearchaeota archaeon]